MTIVVALVMYGLKRRIRRNKGIIALIVGIWLACVLFVGVAVPFMFRHVFQKYQADRIFSLVGRDNPFVVDSTAAAAVAVTPNSKKAKDDKENYNVKQSKIAIGSGACWGRVSQRHANTGRICS